MIIILSLQLQACTGRFRTRTLPLSLAHTWHVQPVRRGHHDEESSLSFTKAPQQLHPGNPAAMRHNQQHSPMRTHETMPQHQHRGQAPA